ncbi:DEAD/DEAH box helicase [Flavimaricola marinus]|uniref:ATP-dependent RNA helicase DeaD n=1 Tax=Flavimaricola marinus TaxID=1819565 RepID=A0A238LIC8_9RHOB|nr:DEAD/DEAH box helicase [Flavimaricola marinus]SMY09155.1 ATP-dependent RNA helicase DeaD [Flavimaricola marinus]
MKKALADALEARGYSALTPVQDAVNKPELIGADMLVSAQTGSGKTVGFGLAIAPTLLGDAETFSMAGPPLALVIAPTRELALQVKRELDWLYAKANVVMASCVGGMDMRDERRALSRGAHIVVATPGRLRDHIMRGSIDLSALRAIVLDEADEMLDLGFREDLEFILGESPDDRQTLLFSATVPASIANLAKKYQRDAVRVVTKSEASQHADIEYQAYTVNERDADNAIINTLRYFEAPNAIVFCNTRAMVGRLTTRLSNRGFSVVALSGELSQNERTHALQAMRDGRARICVATDVAARGIDLPNLDLVIHAELPSNHETLLHRSGRTGRAGRKGTSVLIVPPKARKKAQRILDSAKVRAEWTEAASADAVRARDEERMLAAEVWAEPIPAESAEAVAQLVERFTPEQVAYAYLQLFHANHTAPEELSDADSKPQPRAAFGPTVWFAVPGGRAAGAEPRRLLPMLCKFGDITKDDIGAIRIQQDQTFVEIKEASVAGFLRAVGPDMTVEDGAVLTRLNGAPDLGGPSGAAGPRKGPRPDRPDRPAKPRAEAKPFAKKPYAPKRDDAAESAAPAKPHRHEPPRDAQPSEPSDRRPRPKDASNPSAPIEWDDDRAPRNRKPKPGKGAPSKSKSPFKAKPKSARVEGVVTDFKRKPRADGSAPQDRGPRPPAGKPSSKKNKARAQDRSGPGKPRSGGSAPPRRSKP